MEEMVKDPVCGMDVVPPGKGHSHYQNKDYFFCNSICKIKFDLEPDKYVKLQMKEESKFKTYRPLIIMFMYILLVCTSVQAYIGSFHAHLFMNHFMAGFFIGLSFFKFLDLKSFSEAFSNYDPIAKKFLSYGLVYPFIELGLGLLYVAGRGLFFANIVTIFVLSVTTIGVVKIINSKIKFQCACLGAGFNLPLSSVTVAENAAMILMAIFGITTSI